jgi:peptidoglycan/xylan/chitin deacetylase (PgdA/CDA1 family)
VLPSLPTERPAAAAGPAVIPVLLYHSVADDPRRRDRRYTVSRADFQAHADAIKASGRVALRITDLAAGLRGERGLPERSLAVTFDDGFADTYDAVEALFDRDLTSTVYVTTGELGARNRLPPSSLAELAHGDSTEVGAHAVRHRRLDELDDRELTREVSVSKVALEQLIQLPVCSFAYPHGAYDRRVRRAVITSGYRSAAAVKNAVSHASDDPFAIARWTVTAGTSASRIAEVLEGKGVARARAHERLRTRAYRSARRGRRRLANTLGAHK